MDTIMMLMCCVLREACYLKEYPFWRVLNLLIFDTAKQFLVKSEIHRVGACFLFID